MPPSPRTPYFSIQKLSLASMTKGSELRIFSNGKKLKSARSWPGWLKWSPTPVSKWWVTAALCSVHLFLHGLVAPTFPTYWSGLLWHLPAPWEHLQEAGPSGWSFALVFGRCLSLVIVCQWSLFVVGRCLSLVIVSCWLLFVAGRCLALVVVKENIFQPQIFLFTTNALFCVYVQN